MQLGAAKRQLRLWLLLRQMWRQLRLMLLGAAARQLRLLLLSAAARQMWRHSNGNRCSSEEALVRFIQLGYCVSDIISKCGVGLVIHQIGKAKSEKEGAFLA